MHLDQPEVQPWTLRKRRYLLERWWLKIREDHVVLPDGREIEEFHVAEYPNWAATVCITREGQLVFVEQYRHGIGKVGLELPAGCIEPNEDPLVAAKRELLEETGYAADTWVSLGKCATDPSNQSNYAHLFVAQDAYIQEGQQLDAGEDIAVRLLDQSEAFALADGASERMLHGIHLTALFWASYRGLLNHR